VVRLVNAAPLAVRLRTRRPSSMAARDWPSDPPTYQALLAQSGLIKLASGGAAKALGNTVAPTATARERFIVFFMDRFI
jgi:hypothetical protein